MYGVLQYLGIVSGNPGASGVNLTISRMGNRSHLGGLLLASHPRYEIQIRAHYLRALTISESGDPESAVVLIQELLAENPDLRDRLHRTGDGLRVAPATRRRPRAAYEAGPALIDGMLAQTRTSLEAEGTAITAARYTELRTRIEKLPYERSTLAERLRMLPVRTSP